ncbi:MAG: PilZ domain-containing protein [Polyangiaceae bacterium]
MTDLRRNPRVALDVEVEVAHGQAISRGRAHDISLGGMFVLAGESPPFGAEVTLRFRIPGDAHELALPGIVRWVRTDGMGIQFLPFGVRETHAITEWVKRSG